MKPEKQANSALKDIPSRRPDPLPGEKESALLFSPDWEPILERYRQGDTSVFGLLCCKSNPLVKKISGRRYYSARLGKEEAYSIAAMTMVDFWNSKALSCEPAEIPRHLTQAINCDLLNQIRRNENRSLREIHSEAENESPDGQVFTAGNIIDPEQDVLRKEWNRDVRNCLKYLGKRERQVITGLFFRQMSVAELAAELHANTNAVSLARRDALKKLREVFRDKHITCRPGSHCKTTRNGKDEDRHDQTTLSKHV